MAIYRAQIGFPVDSAFPKDVITMNPHFFGDDAAGLANVLKANLIANTHIGATKPFRVKIYDAQKPPPSYPLAEAENGDGFYVSDQPRELALCLSYYSTWNRPGTRGRIYVPHTFIGGTPQLRPTSGQMLAALSFKDTFSSGLPAGHNWVLYSPTQNKSFGVTNVWVDDEWDIVRSRGLRPTTRQEASVP